MLINPLEITIHKNDNDFSDKFRADRLPQHLNKSVQSASHRNPQPPMKFNASTSPERIANSIIFNQKLDIEPSKRTILGSDIAVMNLRPLDETRMVGHTGPFRFKNQT